MKLFHCLCTYTVTGKSLAHFFSNFLVAPSHFATVRFCKLTGSKIGPTAPGGPHKIREKMCKTFAHDCSNVLIIMFLMLKNRFHQVTPHNKSPVLASKATRGSIIEIAPVFNTAVSLLYAFILAHHKPKVSGNI